jgi:hypothetical protein
MQTLVLRRGGEEIDELPFVRADQTRGLRAFPVAITT